MQIGRLELGCIQSIIGERARIRRTEHGNSGDTRSVGEGILEMRIDHGPGYRICYLPREGQTVIFVAVDGRMAGLIGIADPIKETTPEALAQLHVQGMRLVVLSGDSRATAKAVACGG